MSRKKFSFLLALTLLVSGFGLAPGKKQSSALEEKLNNFFLKDDAIIAVTDSGLGGLAVMAEVAKRMREAGVFRKVNFVFFNSLFSEGGYNSLKTRREKIRIFDSALRSLKKNYEPDLILIACNTLSVIYDQIPFSEETKIPVVGIVDSGVELMAKGLRENPNCSVIIFATETTASEGSHKKALIELGFKPERTIYQACPELVAYIERGHTSEETEMLISAYIDEALNKLPKPWPPLYVSLNCTHYGYSLDLFEKGFENKGLRPLAFLNPNSKLVDFLFEKKRLTRFARTEIQAQVVSMVEISREKIESIGEWLGKISPLISEALRNYVLKSDLFEWQKYVESQN